MLELINYILSNDMKIEIELRLYESERQVLNNLDTFYEKTHAEWKI